MHIAIIASIVIVIIVIIGLVVWYTSGWKRIMSLDWVPVTVDGKEIKGYPWVNATTTPGFIQYIKFAIPAKFPTPKYATELDMVKDVVKTYIAANPAIKSTKYVLVRRAYSCTRPTDTVKTGETGCDTIVAELYNSSFVPLMRSATQPTGNIEIIIPQAPWSAYGVPTQGAWNESGAQSAADIGNQLKAGTGWSPVYNAPFPGTSAGIWKI